MASHLPSHGCHAGFFSQLLRSSVSGVAMASSSACSRSGRALWLLLVRGQVVLCGFCLAEVRSCSVASAWPRSGRALWLLLGRGQVVLCGFCLSEVRSCSVASACPRSGRALWLLPGRGQVVLCGFCLAEGQVVLCGFCLAEVRSCSVAFAWPRSGRALWLLLGRGQVVLCGFCLAEGRSCSVASAWPRSLRRSPASCGSCTVSSRCVCPTGSRPAVSTCSEVVFFCSSARCSLGLCRGHSARSCSLMLVCDRSGLFHTLFVWMLSRILHALFTRGELLVVVPVVPFLAAVVRCPRCLVFRSWFWPLFRVVSIAFLLGSTCYPLLRRSLVAVDDSVFHV